MIAWIGKLISWMLSLWTILPESTKDKIIETIVEGFTELFKQFYKSANKAKEEKNE